MVRAERERLGMSSGIRDEGPKGLAFARGLGFSCPCSSAKARLRVCVRERCQRDSVDATTWGWDAVVGASGRGLLRRCGSRKARDELLCGSRGRVDEEGRGVRWRVEGWRALLALVVARCVACLRGLGSADVWGGCWGFVWGCGVAARLEWRPSLASERVPGKNRVCGAR